MKFSAFIEQELDAIVAEWESFARTLLPAARNMSDLALRNHSREILLAIVHDMQTGQSEEQRADKSKQVQLTAQATRTIAAAHGALRHLEGFDLAQVVSEFRAMRASVLALWRRTEATQTSVPAIEEIARFNEAIDQALAESVDRYSTDVTTFLAVIGHDLRSPLSAIHGSNLLLAREGLTDTARRDAMLRIGRSTKVMEHLIGDLLSYANSRMSRGLAIHLAVCDLGVACSEALDSMRTVFSAQSFESDVSADVVIEADPIRMAQVLVNLLTNAAQHGDGRRPVLLSARGEADAVVLRVANSGKPIPADALQLVFEPMVRLTPDRPDPHHLPYSSLGLGLFVVREIVRAHGGDIDVASSEPDGTVFTVRLPRTSRVVRAGPATPAGT